MLSKNTVYALIFCSVFFLFDPQITEHVEFALSFSGLVPYSSTNGFFVARASEISSQITIPALFLMLGINKYHLQLLISYFLFIVPFFAIWEYCKNVEKPIFFFIIFTSLFYLNQLPNWYFYPYSFPIGFFDFGNAGFWLFFLFTGLLINRNPLAYLLLGFLLAWHLPWFGAGCIFLVTDIYLHGLPKKKIIYINFLFGLIFSLLLIYKSHEMLQVLVPNEDSSTIISKFQNLIKPWKMVDSPFTSHNPKIINESLFQSAYLIFTLLLPTILINISFGSGSAEVLRKKIYKYCNVIGTIVLLTIAYLEIARFISMPMGEIIQRLIINRYLDFSSAIAILIIAIFIYENIFLSNLKIKKRIFLYIGVLCYFFQPSILILISGILILLILFLIKYFLKIKFNDMLIENKIVLYLSPIIFFVLVLIFPKPYYNAFSFFKISNDPILNYLNSNANIKEIILGPIVQSNNGMNVTLFSSRAFYVLSSTKFISNGKQEALYCFDESAKTYSALVLIADNCFSVRPRSQWIEIFNQLNSTTVMVRNNIKLDLDLVAKNDFFSIYTAKP